MIENLYEIERGVTQTLIEHGFQADLLHHGSTNKPRDYVIRLLKDQKDALDGVFAFVEGDRQLSTAYIKELQATLLRSQDVTDGMDSQGRSIKIPLIKGNWKQRANDPVGDGITYTYCPPEQVNSEMDRLVHLHHQHRRDGAPSDVQAAWLHHRFTQIHPFQDGNGRVARALATLVLVRDDGLFPLVVRRDDRNVYLDALEAADDGNLKPLIDLITKLQIPQFSKATRTYESLRIEEDTKSVIQGLKDKVRGATSIRADMLQHETLKEVFDLAEIMEDNLETRLNEVAADIKDLFQASYVARSNSENNYYFRAQIIQNAKSNIGYFANLSEPGVHRSWIALKMNWSRRGQIVFTTHGIGRPFNGSLICAAFLEFKDTDEGGQTSSTLVPIAEDGFVFFYNENQARLLARFEIWRENMLKVALHELSQNL